MRDDDDAEVDAVSVWGTPVAYRIPIRRNTRGLLSTSDSK